MSEIEELKKGVEESVVRQQMVDLNEYIDGLFKKLDVALEARKQHMHQEFLSIILWLGSILLHAFLPNPITTIINSLAYLFWFFTLLSTWVVILPAVFETFKEIDGAFEVLTILGYIKRGDRGVKNKQKVKEPFWERLWAKVKIKQRRAAYGPAAA